MCVCVCVSGREYVCAWVLCVGAGEGETEYMRVCGCV
jgi:hypothetical protein